MYVPHKKTHALLRWKSYRLKDAGILTFNLYSSKTCEGRQYLLSKILFCFQFINDNENLTRVNGILKNVFLIFPQFCLGRGLIDMSVNQAYGDAYARFGVNNYVDPLAWDVTGKSLAAMAIEGLVFFCFNLLIQYRYFLWNITTRLCGF